ncbi:MAG: hypothetical protein ACAI35_24815 [Candidatus Methylacidiphilales bacterium]|nr:hypothetical protein [Candidatus Methylacidiphilales bacterium]
MTRDEFVKRLGTPFGISVSDAIIVTPNGELDCDGELNVKEDIFSFTLRLPPGSKPPEIPGGVVNQVDFWKLEGLIGGNLRFIVPAIPPSHKISHSTSAGETHCSLELHATSLEFVHKGEMQWANLDNLVDTLNAPGAQEQLEAGERISFPIEPDANTDIEFVGKIVNLPLISYTHPTTTTVSCEVIGSSETVKNNTQFGILNGDWEYVLRECETHTEYIFRSRETYNFISIDDEIKHFGAFKKALAFIFGRHFWPLTVQHRRSGKTILDKVGPLVTGADSKHKPFGKRYFVSALAGSINWNFNDILSKLYTYFDQRSELSEEVASLAHLAREASKSEINRDLRIITLCALLENLIRAIGEHTTDKEAEKEALFNTVKGEILEWIDSKIQKSEGWIDQQESKKRKVYKRFWGAVKAPEFWNIEQYFRAVIKELGLTWEGNWDNRFKIWQTHRNVAMHRGISGQELNSTEITFRAESSLACSINMIILRLAGYRGKTNSCTYFDEISDV